MIVRILEDGQYRLDDAAFAVVEPLDLQLEAAISDHDQEQFRATLDLIIEKIHELGERVDHSQVVPSDLALPPAGVTIGEVEALLASEEADT